MNNNRFNPLEENKKSPKKGRFDCLKEEPSRPPRRFYNSRKNTRFESLKPPTLNSRFNDLQKDVLRSPNSDERHGSLKSLPRINSRFESLKPVEKPFREPRRERFRQTEPVEGKFEKIGSMEGMFSNLSVKPKQNKNKKKKKKKKQEAVYEDDEKDKEDRLLTLKMAQAYMYHTDEEEEEVQEDNSAW